jgi:hypothetical protein
MSDEPHAFKTARENIERAWRQTNRRMREAVCLNCWIRCDYESAAMWQIFGRGGVAVRSSVGRLKRALVDPAPVMIGSIEYVDYQAITIPRRNVFTPFLFKRKSYDHKREVRALVVDPTPLSGPMVFGASPIMDDPNAPDGITENGAFIQVDLEALVDAVAVHPAAEDQFLRSVDALCEQHGFRASRSDLDADPIY